MISLTLLVLALIPVTAFAAQDAPAMLSTEHSVGAPQPANDANESPSATIYRISGEPSLRPTRITDDGIHMYLEWDAEQALPAVFAVNAIGEEEMVDGYMRGELFTIDRVHARLVFRIGKKLAKAVRVRDR